MIETLQAGSQAHRVEVEKQSGRTPCELQVRNELGLVRRVKTVDRFDFDNHAAIDEQIDSEIATNPLTAILERDTVFHSHAQASARQFEYQAISIHRFEKSRPHSAMNGDRTTDHQLRQFVDRKSDHPAHRSMKRSVRFVGDFGGVFQLRRPTMKFLRYRSADEMAVPAERPDASGKLG